MKLTKYNVFQDNLANSEWWQERLQPKLKQILLVKGLESVRWDEHPELQKRGIDAVLKQEVVDVELKIRSYQFHKYKDILLEVETGIDPRTRTNGRPGWFYTTKADLVIYVWKNEQESNLVDGYFICMSESLRDWFKKNERRFPEKNALSVNKKTGQIWITRNKSVPIKEFPPGSIVRFNPRLTAEEQPTLEEFLKIGTEIVEPLPEIGIESICEENNEIKIELLDPEDTAIAPDKKKKLEAGDFRG
ncbi:MAG: hypothetical protein H5T49_02880 [Hadesarchaea archaeon]|nr:hypothetical protein [Hadesarchaea archaeon]